jgi:glyoxylase I family protein
MPLHEGDLMSIDIRGMIPLIQVFDMPTSVAFYCDVLGFELLNTSSPGPRFDWAMLSFNGTQLMLNTAYEEDDRPAAPDPTRVDGHSDTGLFFSCPDVDGTYTYLRLRGVEAKKPIVTGYGMKQLYVKDPDGFVLCFQWAAAA